MLYEVITIKPGEFQLWLGENGSGKTSVRHALHCIQRLMNGEHVEDIFSKDTLTRWDKRHEQRIGFSLLIKGEAYKYELTIEYANQEDKQRIKQEKLIWRNNFV